jgi:hypothetical protein
MTASSSRPQPWVLCQQLQHQAAWRPINGFPMDHEALSPLLSGGMVCFPSESARMAGSCN